MLDYLDISRREAHVHVLNRARKLLLDWVSSTYASTQQQRGVEQQQGDAPESREEIELQEKLERLLNASFKYMGVRELQQVRCSSRHSSRRHATGAAAAQCVATAVDCTEQF
jgi:predicted RNA-binding protein Jag